MNEYTAVTFAPVQGFIEKSRKLRDLYGASLILSYLSQQLVLYVKNKNTEGLTVISPGIPKLQKGMPNRILIKGEMSKEEAETVILSAWKDILKVCREWIENKLPEYQYHWEREWTLWGGHTWEIFHGTGCCIEAAMDDLETNKLSRDWSAVNWIGESSSLTGTDAIAYPGLGRKFSDSEVKNKINFTYRYADETIKNFYTKLAIITENQQNSQEESETGEAKQDLETSQEEPEVEGKFIAPNEKLSIPELVKRLVTCENVRKDIGIALGDRNSCFGKLPKGFKEIRRKPTETQPGQWTGWFMGDGDEVGKKLKQMAKSDQPEVEINTFTTALRKWGKNFYTYFEHEKRLGRVIYAGGDDFLGIIYSYSKNVKQPIDSKNVKQPIDGLSALEWLMTLNDKWHEHKRDINVSVGFVWVAGSVPQRDVLQHCRQAQETAKNLQRDRVTIRIVFNSGQYVEWTCPWKYLHILKEYRDRNSNTYPEWEGKGRDSQNQPNWSHIYGDLAQLKSRHAFGLAENRRHQEIDSDNTAKQSKILDYRRDFLEFFDIYFPGYKEILTKDEKFIVGANDDTSSAQKALLMIDWIENLITIGWHLCSNTNTSSLLDL